MPSPIAQRFTQLTARVITNDAQHCLWLNTLSLMENTGARKISAGEDPLNVDEGILKHAFEEHRHAYALKRQIRKLRDNGFEDYKPESVLAPLDSYRYLHRLDMRISRYLREQLGLVGRELKFAAYLLVTYAIEVKADTVYSVYQEQLKEAGSPVSVRAILAEEEQHLAEMHRQMDKHIPHWEKHGAWACAEEDKLCMAWLDKVETALGKRGKL